MFKRPAYISIEEKEDILKRLIQKDPALWVKSDDAKEAVKNRLGWLNCLSFMKEHIKDIKEFSDKVKEMGIKDIVLLGMGGSSLAPLVMSQIFGSAEGFPNMYVIDSTDPDYIEEIKEKIDINNTLFIVASKSGTTIEPNMLFAYFWDIIEKNKGGANGGAGDGAAGRQFMAITDPNSPLEELAREKGFLKCFLNMPDIGGRYSALSMFGLVPAALIGIDIERLLEEGQNMASRCLKDPVSWKDNPAATLGEFLGEYAVQSRDKLTLLFDDELRPFGLWLDQLVAESTGKDTHGLVPIIGETTGIPGFYGAERIFVYTRLSSTPDDKGVKGFIKELKEAEFPVYELTLNNLYELGGQFFMWEMAVALASHFIGVNPFDEPDVVSSKKKTKEAIEAYEREGKFPVKFWIDPKSNINFRASKILAPSMKGLSRAIMDMFQVLPSWGYVAFLPYLPYKEELDDLFTDMRHLVRQEKGCATTLGYGPRYLHSSGQLYKGGPLSGGYFIFTRKRSKDREYDAIPEHNISFWHMQFAQAIGDFNALADGGKRALHIHLPADYITGLETFKRVLSRAIRL